MKAKITRGSCFVGCTSYVLRSGAMAEIIGGNLDGRTAADFARGLQSAANLRPEIQKPVWHGSLSLPAGERLTDDVWNLVAQDYATRLGFNLGNTPYLIVRHTNTKYDHLHIITSRVNFARELYLGQNEHLKATKLTQEFEKKYGLIRTTGPEQKAQKKALTTQETEMSERTGKLAPRKRLQNAIDLHIRDGPTVEDLILRLEAEGVTARPNVASTGRMNGFSFQVDGVSFKASQLGRDYGWQGLQTRGVELAADRDARLQSLQLERHRLIDRLFSSSDRYAEIGSEERMRYLLAIEVNKLTHDAEKLPTKQIKQYTDMSNCEELRHELYRLRKINRQKKERGPRILSL